MFALLYGKFKHKTYDKIYIVSSLHISIVSYFVNLKATQATEEDLDDAIEVISSTLA